MGSLFTSFDALVIIDQCYGNNLGLRITYPIEIDGMCGNEVSEQRINIGYIQVPIVLLQPKNGT